MIYIVEDDTAIRELEVYALNTSGLSACSFESAEDFWQAIKQNTPDLIILDVMLPGEDGFSILKKLRSVSVTAHIPIIMITAKSDELDIVKALDSGADDYLTKPFRIMEFISRVKAALRRSGSDDSTAISTISFREITLCESRRTTMVAGTSVDLTYKEFELLRLFLQRAERVVSRDQLLRDIWDVDVPVESRTVDMHIRTLRQKLGDAGRYIKTVRKVGYMLTENEGSDMK